MMKFLNEEVKLEINVIGYEYEHSRDNDDSNWLIVQIYIERFNGQSWSATDPCLRTMELVELREWLLSVLEKKVSLPKLYFMENELFFIHDGNGNISIALDYALHPNWKKYDFNNDSEEVFNFLLDDDELKKLIIELDKLIILFPERKFDC